MQVLQLSCDVDARYFRSAVRIHVLSARHAPRPYPAPPIASSGRAVRRPKCCDPKPFNGRGGVVWEPNCKLVLKAKHNYTYNIKNGEYCTVFSVQDSVQVFSVYVLIFILCKQTNQKITKETSVYVNTIRQSGGTKQVVAHKQKLLKHGIKRLQMSHRGPKL